jgi:hypothetical protein
LLVMMSSSKKYGPMILSCVGAHHAFTLGLSHSCSKCSVRDSQPQMTQLCRFQR